MTTNHADKAHSSLCCGCDWPFHDEQTQDLGTHQRLTGSWCNAGSRLSPHCIRRPRQRSCRAPCRDQQGRHTLSSCPMDPRSSSGRRASSWSKSPQTGRSCRTVRDVWSLSAGYTAAQPGHRQQQQRRGAGSVSICMICKTVHAGPVCTGAKNGHTGQLHCAMLYGCVQFGWTGSVWRQ
jgi:hypothetical protein